MFDFFFSTDSQDRSIFDTRIQLNLFYKTPCYLRSFFMISEVRIIRINVNVLLITVSTIRFLFSTPLLCILRFSTPISKHPPTREFNLPSTYFTKYFHKPYQTTSNCGNWIHSLTTLKEKKKRKKKKKPLDCHHQNVTKTSTNPFNPLPMSPHDRSSCLNQLATRPSSKSSCSIGFTLCGTGGRVGSCTRPGLIFRARSRKYNDSCKKAQVRPSWQRLPTNQRVQRMAAKVRKGRGEWIEGTQGTRRARLYQFFDRLLIPLKRSIPLPPPVYAWACEFLWWQHAPKTNRRLRAALCAFFNDSTSSCPDWDGKREEGGEKKGNTA